MLERPIPKRLQLTPNFVSLFTYLLRFLSEHVELELAYHGTVCFQVSIGSLEALSANLPAIHQIILLMGFIFIIRFYVKCNTTIAGPIILVRVTAIAIIRGIIILFGLPFPFLHRDFVLMSLLRCFRIYAKHAFRSPSLAYSLWLL